MYAPSTSASAERSEVRGHGTSPVMAPVREPEPAVDSDAGKKSDTSVFIAPVAMNSAQAATSNWLVDSGAGMSGTSSTINLRETMRCKIPIPPAFGAVVNATTEGMISYPTFKKLGIKAIHIEGMHHIKRRMALYSVRERDMFSHIHRVCGHMSATYIKSHRENSNNAEFADAKKVRALCKACVYGEDRQISPKRHRIHRSLLTIEGQYFVVDAFACGHTSHRGFRHCNVMKDGASQVIFCDFTKRRGAEEMVNALTKL